MFRRLPITEYAQFLRKRGGFVVQVSFQSVARFTIGFVELCAKILQIMRNDFKDYARTFCQLFYATFCQKTFLGFVLHIAEYKIDLFYVYGIDEIAYRHLQKLRTFCIPWPDRLH